MSASAGDELRIRSLRVLVVDDDGAVRRIATRVLARRGHRVDEVADGWDAVSRIGDAEAQDPYDVILSDLRMPGLDGGGLRAELCSRWPGMERRLVFLSGGACEDALAAAGSGGAVPLLRKPFEFVELTWVVEARAAPSAA